MTPERVEHSRGGNERRLLDLDARIADCHTRRKAAIMRAAAATRVEPAPASDATLGEDSTGRTTRHSNHVHQGSDGEHTERN